MTKSLTLKKSDSFQKVFLLSMCLFYNHCFGQNVFLTNIHKRVAYTNFSTLGNSYYSTLGYAKKDSIKLLKTSILGFIDVSFPFSKNHFNNLLIRKGFQCILRSNRSFTFPLVFSSTTVLHHNHNEKRHDITSEVDFIPSYHYNKYTFSIFSGAEIILFTRVRSMNNTTPNNAVKPHWEKPNIIVPKLGMNIQYNTKHLIYNFSCLFEKNPYCKLDVRNHHRNFISSLVGVMYKF